MDDHNNSVDIGYHVGLPDISGKPVKDHGNAESDSRRKHCSSRVFPISAICFPYWDFMLSTMSSI